MFGKLLIYRSLFSSTFDLSFKQNKKRRAMKTNSTFYSAVLIIIKLLPVLLIIAVAVSAQAQGLKGATYVEKTKMTLKMGHSVGVTLPGYLGDMEVGGFYQKAMVDPGVESTRRKVIEEKFYGLYMGVSFLQTQRVNMNFNVRAGAVNDKYLVITPSVYSDVALTSFLAVGAGLGMRNLMPTYQARVTVKLGNSNRGYAYKYKYRR